MPKTLAMRVIEKRTAVLVVGPNTPDDQEWDDVCDVLRKNVHDRALVVTDGGGPTARQRKVIIDAAGGRKIPTAVMTDSVLVRGITTAMAWFVPEVQAFKPDDLRGALDYLKVTTPVADVDRVVTALRREMAEANRKAG